MLEDAHIETSTRADLFDVLDVDMGGELAIGELVDGLMRLRGPITKSDIVAVRLKVSYMTKMVEDLWQKLCNDDGKDDTTLHEHCRMSRRSVRVVPDVPERRVS